jgi:acetyl-CoA/propionyl-CoA carboxylase carboxyl transferase subunit
MREQAEAAGGVGRAREIGVVDDVIAPADTRHRIAEVLSGVPAARGWHTNIPL